MIPRLGERVRPSQRYTPRPGAYVLACRGGDVLLTFQAEPAPEFQLPGGGIDEGEAPLAALHREVMEETGWRIAAPRKVAVMRRFVFMPEYDLWAEKVCHIYRAHPVRVIAAPTEPGHSAHWVPLPRAAHLVANPIDAAVLSRALD